MWLKSGEMLAAFDVQWRSYCGVVIFGGKDISLKGYAWVLATRIDLQQ
jgi:hypothetical protein